MQLPCDFRTHSKSFDHPKAAKEIVRVKQIGVSGSEDGSITVVNRVISGFVAGKDVSVFVSGAHDVQNRKPIIKKIMSFRIKPYLTFILFLIWHLHYRKKNYAPLISRMHVKMFCSNTAG